MVRTSGRAWRLAVRSIVVACAVMGAALPSLAFAQRKSTQQVQDSANLFNWYYGTAFGSGYYRVDGTESLVVRVPLSYRLREATRDQWGVKLIAPVTAGVVNTDGQGLVPDTLNTVSMSVGAELDIVMTDAWRLRPYATIGGGREFRLDSTARIAVLGLKTRYRLPIDGYDVDLGASIVASRAWTRTDRDTLGQTALGLDWTLPFVVDVHGPSRIALSAIQYWYFNDAAFLMPTGEVRALTRETEIGVAMRPQKPWTVLGFDVERIGAGVRFGQNVWGVQVFTSFPF